MSDVLSSILGSMQKPPGISENDRKKAKAEAEKLKKLKATEQNMREKFRKNVEMIISEFVKDPSKTRYACKSMTKLQRTIVHELAEDAGLTSQAFGVEDVDRYVMLMKKEHPASEDEINAYKNGEEWNEKESQRKKQLKAEQDKRLMKECDWSAASEPTTNYKDKYNHLIGKTSAKEAARKTEANKSFGMVPSRNKRDLRSIEETMNEIRAKKMKKQQDS